MEYQKIANLLNDASNQPSKFRTRHYMMNQEEHILVTILNLKLQYKVLIYVIMQMHTYL